MASVFNTPPSAGRSTIPGLNQEIHTTIGQQGKYMYTVRAEDEQGP